MLSVMLAGLLMTGHCCMLM